MNNEQVPPHDLETERAMLGAMLLDADAAGSAVNLLGESDFYRTSHRKIFKAVSSLYNRNITPDELLLRDELRRTGELEEIGGAEAIRELGRDVTSAAFAEHWIRLLLDCARRRRLIEVTTHAQRILYESHDTIDEIVAELSDVLLHELEQNLPDGARQISSALDMVRDRMAGGDAPVLTTGITDFDARAGGFSDAEYIVLASRPSVGKSSMAYNIALHVLKEHPDQTVLFYSLEVTADAVAQSMCAVLANTDPELVYSGRVSDDRIDAFEAAVAWLATQSLYVDDSANISTVYFRSSAQSHVQRHKTALIIVDYAQLMKAAIEDRQQELERISQGFKSVAKETGVPVLALCQLNREAEGRFPRMSHLKGSGSFEQDADKVLFLHRPKDEEKHNVDLVAVKNRNGPTFRIGLHFTPFSRRFSAAARGEEGSYREI